MLNTRFIHFGTNIGIFQHGITHLQTTNPLHKFIHKGIVDPFVHIHPLIAGTDLPAVIKAGMQRPFHRDIEVGIFKNDTRRFAT